MDSLFKKFGIKVKAGEILFSEYESGNVVYFLLKGSVKLSKISNDKEKNLAILEAGAIFGEMSLLDNQPRSATCVAESDCELLELNRENFEFLIKSKRALGIKLLRTLVSRIVDQERKLRLLKHRKDEVKVLDTLLMLAEERGIGPETKSVLVPEKTEEIANWVGLEVTQCTETLNDLERLGRIEIVENGIILKSLETIRGILQKELKELNQ